MMAIIDEFSADPNPVMRNAATLEKLKETFRSDSIADRQIFDAVVIYYQTGKELDYAVKIYGENLEYEELYHFLHGYDFSLNSLEFETSLPKELAPYLLGKRVLIKENGVSWIVHKNDKDPYPSHPHAHNVDNNLKLHLGTGGIYKKKNQLSKISKKELLQIRDKLEPKLKKIGISLPELTAQTSN